MFLTVNNLAPATSSKAIAPTMMPAMAPPEMPPPPLLGLGAAAGAGVTVMPPFVVRTSWTLDTVNPVAEGQPDDRGSDLELLTGSL